MGEMVRWIAFAEDTEGSVSACGSLPEASGAEHPRSRRPATPPGPYTPRTARFSAILAT